EILRGHYRITEPTCIRVQACPSAGVCQPWPLPLRQGCRQRWRSPDREPAPKRGREGDHIGPNPSVRWLHCVVRYSPSRSSPGGTLPSDLLSLVLSLVVPRAAIRYPAAPAAALAPRAATLPRHREA